MNQRKHFRHYFKDKTPAKLSITRILSKPILTKEAIVFVQDISASGMRFSTPLRFPVHSRILLQIKINLMNHDFLLHGHIVRRDPSSASLFYYGFQFIEEQKYLNYIIKQLSFKLFSNRSSIG